MQCFYADKPEAQAQLKQKCGGPVLWEACRGHFKEPIILCHEHKRWWNKLASGTNCPMCVARRIEPEPPGNEFPAPV